MTFVGGFADGYGTPETGAETTIRPYLDAGVWYRHTDGRLRFVYGARRSLTIGMGGWEKVSPKVAFTDTDDVDDASWNTLTTYSSDTAAVLLEKMRTCFTSAGFTYVK